MHIAESRELPGILLTLTLCSCQITIGPSLGFSKPMYIPLSRLIRPTRFGRCKVHCTQKVPCRQTSHHAWTKFWQTHNLIKQPAAPVCEINMPNKDYLYVSVASWSCPRWHLCLNAAHSRFLFFFTSSQVKPEPNWKKQEYNERLLLWITWGPCRIQKMWSFV